MAHQVITNRTLLRCICVLTKRAVTIIMNEALAFRVSKQYQQKQSTTATGTAHVRMPPQPETKTKKFVTVGFKRFTRTGAYKGADSLRGRLALRAANLGLLATLFLDLLQGGAHNCAVELGRLARTGSGVTHTHKNT